MRGMPGKGPDVRSGFLVLHLHIAKGSYCCREGRDCRKFISNERREIMRTFKENVIRRDEVVEDGDPSPLDTFVQRVSEDASARPKAYLKETIVPEGGE